MFTGLIQNRGSVISLLTTASGALLKIRPRTEEDWKVGESISVNGACLTLIDVQNNDLSFDLSSETLDRTTLRDLKPEKEVHLERALRPSDRFGGHFVQGHIDGVGEVRSVEIVSDYRLLRLHIPQSLMSWMIEKGSIAVDGVSLTINRVSERDSTVDLMLIPTTLALTEFLHLKFGDRVNVEADMLAKMVWKNLQSQRTANAEATR